MSLYKACHRATPKNFKFAYFDDFKIVGFKFIKEFKLLYLRSNYTHLRV